MGLYGKLSFIHGAEASLSYAIDDESPVNFTLTAPSRNIHFLTQWQLIVQTPPLTHGPHTFQMILLDVKPTRNATSIAPQLIVIQNTTSPRSLDPVPPILSVGAGPSTTTKNDVNKNTSISRGALIGAVVGGAIVLLMLLTLVICFIRRVIRRRSTRDKDIRTLTLPSPFLPDGKTRLRIAQHISRPKLEKYRHALRMPAFSDSTHALHSPEKEENWPNDDREETQSSGLQPEVNMRTGQSSEYSEKAEEDIEENVSLPPSYTVFRHI